MVNSIFFMAFSVKITGYSKPDGAKIVQMEPYWWNARELMHDDRFKETNKHGRFQDYSADLSRDEVRELYERYKSNIPTNQQWLRLKLRRITPGCRKLYSALFGRASRHSYFHIDVVEWDPGL